MTDDNERSGISAVEEVTVDDNPGEDSHAESVELESHTEKKEPEMKSQNPNDVSLVSEKALEQEITDVLTSLWGFKEILVDFKGMIEKTGGSSIDEMSKKFAEISCNINAFHEKLRLSENTEDKLKNLRAIGTQLDDAAANVHKNQAKDQTCLEIAEKTAPLIEHYSDLVEKVSLLESNLQTYFRMNKSDDERKKIAKSQAILHGSSAIIRSQEMERQRIAREIHDGPAQAIANVIFRLDIIHKMIDQNPDSIPEEMSKVKEIAQGALNEIRHFIFDLRPMTLQDLGLTATLKKIIQSGSGKYNTKADLIIEGNEMELNPEVDLAIFRIAQESLNNIRKHANASQAWIHLKYFADKVVLIVEDNGMGFDVKNRKQKEDAEYSSFGLIGMQERADDIGGTLQVTSQSMRGTKVILTIPIENCK